VYYALFAKETPRHRWWDSISASLVLHVIGIIVLTRLVATAPQTVHKISTQESIAIIAPLLEPRATTMMPPRVKVVAPPPVAALRVPPALKLPATKREVEPPLQRPPLPQAKVEMPSLPAAAPVVPTRKREVITNTFAKDAAGNTGSSAKPTIAQRPAYEVQTGGFGDPNGVPGQGKKDAKLTIASLGSFDLPGGSGYGNGTGGKRGAAGVIASSGFGNGVAAPVQGGSGNGHAGGRVVQGGFSDNTQPVASVSKPRTVESKPVFSPVEIISKPRPVYSAEARKLHLEGEVLLDVVFTAMGDVRVVKVVKGLGHGLDEAALHAAQQIRFRPAKRDGQPYDSAAVVHIVFALAE
jgi:TonB family protein